MTRPVIFLIAFICAISLVASAQQSKPVLHFTVSIPNPEKKTIHVQLDGKGWAMDTKASRISQQIVRSWMTANK